MISDCEAAHGRQVRWTLRARNATDTIRQRWAGASWIIELVSTGLRGSKPFRQVHYFLTTVNDGTCPEKPVHLSHGDLPAPRCRLRTGASAKSKAMVTIKQVLAPTAGGLDQSAPG